MGNVNMEAYQVHYEGKSVAEKLKELEVDVEKAAALPDLPTDEGKTVLTAVTDGQGDTELTYESPEVKAEDIAPAFSEEVTYPSGTIVYYEGNLYKFTADHAAGTWDPSEVTQTSVAAEFVETNAAVDELKNTLNTYTYADIASEVTDEHSSVSQVHHVYVMTYGKLCIIGLSFTTSTATVAWSTFFKIPVTNILPAVNPSGWGDLYIGLSGSITSRVPLTAGDHYYQLVYLIS